MKSLVDLCVVKCSENLVNLHDVPENVSHLLEDRYRKNHKKAFSSTLKALQKIQNILNNFDTFDNNEHCIFLRKSVVVDEHFAGGCYANFQWGFGQDKPWIMIIDDRNHILLPLAANGIFGIDESKRWLNYYGRFYLR